MNFVIYIFAGFGFLALLGASFFAGFIYSSSITTKAIIETMEENGTTVEEGKRFLELMGRKQ